MLVSNIGPQQKEINANDIDKSVDPKQLVNPFDQKFYLESIRFKWIRLKFSIRFGLILSPSAFFNRHELATLTNLKA